MVKGVSRPPQTPPQRLWEKTKETIIDNIGVAVGGVVATAAIAGAVAAWAALKTWVIVEIPSGLVVASLNECRDLRGGWASFDPAGGRFIVGAGAHPQHPNAKLSYTAFAKDGAEQTAGWEPSTGGEEKHLLTIAEMPSHSHPGFVGTGGASFEHHQANTRMPSEFWDKKTGETGGGQAHPIIPPYIALYYCKKT